MPSAASARDHRRPGRPPRGTCTTNTNQLRRSCPRSSQGSTSPSMPASRSRYRRATRSRSREQGVEPLDLGHADRRRDVREPVVEAQPVVREPVHVVGAALVALAADAAPRPRRRRRSASRPPPSRAACSRRSRTPPGCRSPPPCTPAESTAPSASHASSTTPSPRSAGERLERLHVGRIAEQVHRQQPGRARSARRGGGIRVDVQGALVDVAEDRHRVLVQQAVRRRDEAQRRGDDLVAARPSPAPAPRGAAPRCRSTRPPRPSLPTQAAKSRSKRSSIGPSDSRPERSTSLHQLLLARAHVRPRERDLARPSQRRRDGCLLGAGGSATRSRARAPAARTRASRRAPPSSPR